MTTYDCIIVGAGPAGIFAALELLGRGARVLVIEKGPDINERTRKDLYSGWGGAGAYSDGKLNLSKEVGGFLGDYMSPEELDSLISRVDSVFLSHGAPTELKGTDQKEVSLLVDAASSAGLKLTPFPIRHMGTDTCLSVLKNLRDSIGKNVELLFNASVEEVVIEDGCVKGVRAFDNRTFNARHVILCPGRSGAAWLKDVAIALGLDTATNPVDIGVRVEVPATVLKRVTDVLHEAKLYYNTRAFDDVVRTFCMNPYGYVVKEGNSHLSTVNGHSYSAKRSSNTNFAMLVSTNFTEPFKEPIAYGQYVARLANLLGSGIIVQRLGDLHRGRRSTPERIKNGLVCPTLAEATPGDLSFVMPYRYLSGIIETLEALDAFAPGVNSASTLLYGVEVKFYSMRLKLSRALETVIKNLFAAGDGAGVSRGIVHACASGAHAGQEVARRLSAAGT